MKEINIKTLIPETYRFMARDLDGSVYVFEDKPSIATDIACDTWDVKPGEILQISPPTPKTRTRVTINRLRNFSIFPITNFPFFKAPL